MFEGTPQEFWHSLLKLRALPDDTLLYCGHEYTQSNARFALSVDPSNQTLLTLSEKIDERRSKGLPTIPSRLGDEKIANPFLRADDKKLAVDVGASEDPIHAFAVIRQLKDNF
jgi:hydroxyacylglutathione hydrolase